MIVEFDETYIFCRLVSICKVSGFPCKTCYFHCNFTFKVNFEQQLLVNWCGDPNFIYKKSEKKRKNHIFIWKTQYFGNLFFR